MKIEAITEENVEEYRGLVDEEFLSNTGREYFQGMACMNELTDEPDAVIFWELRDIESDDGKSAEIVYYHAENEDSGAEILAAYDEWVGVDDVKRTYFEFQGAGEIERITLERNGFRVEQTESMDIYVTVDELASLKYAAKKVPDYVKSLSALTVKQFKAGIMASVLHGRYGLLEDLPFLPMSWFDTDLSSCVITDNKINGLLLMHELPSGILRVELLFAMEPDAAVNMLSMIRNSIHSAAELREGDDRVLLRRHSVEARKLVDYLFPDKKGGQALKGSKG